jgi:NAD(P)-dependent dehydrogenase (short-subunit alcohol dehydrogenase family)
MTAPEPSAAETAPLAGKTALVTGAATGIGKAIATALAAHGAQVAVNHDHTPEPAEKVVADIQAAGGSAMAVAADVSSRAEYQAMVEQVLAPWGRWDVWSLTGQADRPGSGATTGTSAP